MIFCHCAVVGDHEVAEAVDAGADTVAEVCRATGAGQQCGSCIFSVRRVLCDHQARRGGQADVQSQSQSRAEGQTKGRAQPAAVIGVDVAAS